MKRRKFSQEYKFEAVKLVRDLGVTAAQAARDLDLHENVLRKWVCEAEADPHSAFPGNDQMKPESQEIERLRRELARMKAERDILKKAAAYSARDSIRSSGSSPSIEGFGRYRGFAGRSVFRAVVPRLARARAERPVAQRRRVCRENPSQLRLQLPDLWGTSRLDRPPGRRPVMSSASGRTPDAPPRA